MHRILELSLANRLVVLILAGLLVAGGIAAFRGLPIDAFPDVTNIQVTVISQAPTLSPLEIEQLVTYPIEQACAGLPHSTEVRSLSKFGLSMVTVVFEDGTDIYFARQLVLERMLSAPATSCPRVSASSLGPISTGLGEVFQYTLESPSREPDGAAHPAGLGAAADPADRRRRRRGRLASAATCASTTWWPIPRRCGATGSPSTSWPTRWRPTTASPAAPTSSAAASSSWCAATAGSASVDDLEGDRRRLSRPRARSCCGRWRRRDRPRDPPGRDQPRRRGRDRRRHRADAAGRLRPGRGRRGQGEARGGPAEPARRTSRSCPSTIAASWSKRPSAR